MLDFEVKSPGELTETEMLKLRLAQSELCRAALQFSVRRNGDDEMFLYAAARRFDETCVEVGFKDHWKIELVEPTQFNANSCS